MMIVTGGAGFIGSNILQGLNARGIDDILVVDDLTDGTKFKNMVDARIADYMDKDDFLDSLLGGDFEESSIEAVFHQGACSSTTEWDGQFMMENNYEYSKPYCIFVRPIKFRLFTPLVHLYTAVVACLRKTWRMKRH